MKVENVEVYDLERSIRASKYPMSVDTEYCDDSLTGTAVRLAQSEKGSGHDQWISGVLVSFDLTCSNKMWVELERYRFITFVSSQSTMHRIANFNLSKQYNKYVDPRIISIMIELKDQYNKTKAEEDFFKLIYSNPAGFELTARLTTNYRCLKGVYAQRLSHRLPEWRDFCSWIATLPYAKDLIVGGKNG